MGRLVASLALALLVIPTVAFAADDDQYSDGFGNHAHARQASDEEPPPPSEPAPKAESSSNGAPRKSSLSLDLGGALASLGCAHYTKLAFSGDTGEGFHYDAFGNGGAFRLQYDTTAMDMDWRVGLNGALPGYLGLRATAGVTQNIGPTENPRFLARGGGGIELTLASTDEATYLVPNFLVDGELAGEYEVVPNRFVLGAVFELAVRYGLPVGIGLDVGGYLRAKLML